MPLSQEAYRNSGMSKCPHCGSDEISGGTPQVDGSSAWVPVECEACGECWDDVYEFVRYEQTQRRV